MELELENVKAAVLEAARQLGYLSEIQYKTCS